MTDTQQLESDFVDILLGNLPYLPSTINSNYLGNRDEHTGYGLSNTSKIYRIGKSKPLYRGNRPDQYTIDCILSNYRCILDSNQVIT